MYAPPGPSGSIASRSRCIVGAISQLPSRPRTFVLAVSVTSRSARLETPSISFSVMLPVKPSITTTSATPSGICVPSMLPTKFRPAPREPASCSCTETSSGVPLPGSSPLDSSATRGESIPSTAWANADPMCANWTRCSGRQVTLAPTSSSRTGDAAGVRQRQRERRPVDAAVAPEVEQRGRERRAGRAAGHERLRAAVGDRAGRLDDRRLRRRAHRVRGVGLLGDRDRGVDDLDAVRHRVRSRRPGRTAARWMPSAAARAAPAATSRGPRSAPPASTATVTTPGALRRSARPDPGR